MKSVATHVMAVAMLLASAYAQTAEDEGIFRGKSPKGDDGGPSSWATQSANNNPWTSGATAGAIIGFSVFALSYLYVVVYIFYDINRSKHNYMEMVADDKNVIRQLNVSKNTLDEWETQL